MGGLGHTKGIVQPVYLVRAQRHTMQTNVDYDRAVDWKMYRVVGVSYVVATDVEDFADSA